MIEGGELVVELVVLMLEVLVLVVLAVEALAVEMLVLAEPLHEESSTPPRAGHETISSEKGESRQ